MSADLYSQHVRQYAGLFDLSNTLGLITVSGSDRTHFLQALTSNEVTGLDVGACNHQMILDKKSHVLADFWLYPREEDLLLVTESEQISVITQFLETYHFTEDIKIEGPLDGWSLMGLQGKVALECLQASFDLPENFMARKGTRSVKLQVDQRDFWILPRMVTGDYGCFLACFRDQHESLRQRMLGRSKKFHLQICDADTYEMLRIESGIPRFGTDMDANTLIRDLGKDEELISFTKGCFPGQEIVARTRSRGNLQKRLFGIQFKENIPVPPGTELGVQGKPSAWTRSSCWSTFLQKTCVMAYVRRGLQPDKTWRSFEWEGSQYQGEIVQLPFYYPETYKEQAKVHYQKGLDFYHANQFLDAKSELELGLEGDPHNPDLYEALALTLEKLSDVEGAILQNIRFADLDPMAVMAHANLSRLYLLQGDKDKAEEEQAIATSLGLRLKSREQVAAKDAAADKAEQERRLAIFHQVLEIDPKDVIANFSLGQFFSGNQEWNKAKEHLETVVRHHEKHAAAYPVLGKVYLGLGDTEKARVLLLKGISIAKDGGHLMPLGEMESMLQKIGDACA